MIHRILLIAALVSLLSSCKLVLMVTSGGDLQSLSGNNDCAGGNLCEIEILDTSFDETFTAIPRAGYVFEKWQGGQGYLCPESTNPTCAISNTFLAGVAGAEPVIASGAFYYAKPVFKFVGIDTDGDGIKDYLDEDDDNDGILDVDDPCPLIDDVTCTLITDTITVDGREWAQPGLFNGINRPGILSVCSGSAGECTSSTLNGYKMTGWRFASREDVQSLFNHYLAEAGVSGTDLLGPCDRYDEIDSTWAPAFFSDGWTGNAGGNNIRGFTRDWRVCNGVDDDGAIINDAPDRSNTEVGNDVMNLHMNLAGSSGPESNGAWIYRDL